MKKILYITLFAALILGCRKDKLIPEEVGIGNSSCNCPEEYTNGTLPLDSTFDIQKTNTQPGCPFLPEYIPITPNYYLHPAINPNNPYEFTFIRANIDDQQNNGTYVFNMCTKELTFLNVQGSNMDWSVKDWIIYIGNDNQLYKIKSNGDSLTQLTNNGSFNYNPKWNPNGTKFIYQDVTVPNGWYTLANEDGSVDRIVEHKLGVSAWLNNEEIIYSNVGNNQLRKYNFTTDEVEVLVSGYGLGGNKISVKDGKVYLDGHYGTYKYENYALELLDSNYVTYEADYVQPAAENRLLLQRNIADTSAYLDCIVYSAAFISLYDMTTGEERRILIPE